MKIAILTQYPDKYSTRQMVAAIEGRGHEAVILDYMRCTMTIASGRPEVSHLGLPVRGLDAVVPRIGASASFYGAAVVRQFEAMGVYCINGSQAIARARDKLRSLQILARKGIGMPVTAFAHSPEDTDDVIDSVGGAPLVIKLVEGTQGIGVVLAETRQAARSVIEAFRGLDVHILVQEFIAEAQGSDVRCFVVGDRVVAAMRRQGRPGEFRSNLHRGGSAEATVLSADERATAVRAARALRLRMAGVDILRSNRGPLVMEVNASPGLEGIQTATKLDVAGRIVDFIVRDVDELRARASQPATSSPAAAEPAKTNPLTGELVENPELDPLTGSPRGD